MGIDPVALVYLTDGYAPAPDAPDYPVIWGVTNPQYQRASAGRGAVRSS